jgi:mono/diheme cytochrome c family protein
VAVLAACGPEQDRGYGKVSYRDRDDLPELAYPPPPRVTASALAAASGGGGQVVAASLPAGVTQVMVDEGQQLYGTVCVACHGSGGAGSPAGPALNDGEWLHIGGEYPEITNIITVGVAQPRQYPGAMPARGGGNFSDDQVRALAAYVYALSHQEGS